MDAEFLREMRPGDFDFRVVGTYIAWKPMDQIRQPRETHGWRRRETL